MEQKQSSAKANGERRNVRVLVVAGPAGSGKTSLGREVASRLGWAFEDADDHHSEAANRKMARGEGLTDADRAPWLARLADLIRERAEVENPALQHCGTGPRTVLACSALKRAYREVVAPSRWRHSPLGQEGTGMEDGEGTVLMVWLHVPEDILRQRLVARSDHLAGPDLLPSQLRDAEPPALDESVWILDGTRPLAELARDLADRLRSV